MSLLKKITSIFSGLLTTLASTMIWLKNHYTMQLNNFLTKKMWLTLLIAVAVFSTFALFCLKRGDQRPAPSTASTSHPAVNCTTDQPTSQKTSPMNCTTSPSKNSKDYTGTTNCCLRHTSTKDTASAACHEPQGFPGLPLASPSTECASTCKKN